MKFTLPLERSEGKARIDGNDLVSPPRQQGMLSLTISLAGAAG
jgi:hypothetical protein